MNPSYIILLLCVSCFNLLAQPEGITWQQTIGGEGNEWIGGVTRGSDGTFLACGYTTSTEDGFSQNQGGYDMFIAEFSSFGEPLQFKTLGSSAYDEANDVVALPAGGYAVIGIVSEDNGDITGPVFGANDAWLGVFDENLLLINQLSFGGNLSEEGTALITTEDGGLLLTGRTSSTNGALGEAYGQDDIFLIKLAADLSIEWTNTYGGSEWDRPAALAETSNGYVVTGSSASSDNDVASNQGGLDIWVFQVSPSGDLLWSSSFGGSSSDEPESIAIDQNQNIIVAGHSNSDDGDVIGNIGGRDGLVLTFSANGTLLDQDHFGTNLDDFFYDIYIESDGSKTCVGITNASAQLGGLGGSDYYLVKLNTSNEVVWQEIYGGSLADGGYHILPDADGYLLAGEHYSSDGDITTHYSARDVSLLRLGEVIAVSGCTDPMACNYSDSATIDDGSCEYVTLYALLGNTLCETQSVEPYTYFGNEGSTYQWQITGGDILSGQGASEITVVWTTVTNLGQLCVTETTAAGCEGDDVCIDVTVLPTNIESIEGSTIVLYPNPATEFFVLSLDPKWVGSTYILLDNRGRIAVSGTAQQQITTINLGDCRNGNYLLRLINGNTTTQRLVVVAR
jgi:hypothetical protein